MIDSEGYRANVGIVITNDKQQASWLVTTDNISRQATVKVLNAQTIAADKVFELWMLADNQPPVSMGLLSASEDRTLTLSAKQVQELQKAKGLAVSLEPTGGSPTGLPTGPVLYQGAMQPV